MDTPSVQHHFNLTAKDYDFWKQKARYYYSQLKQLFGEFIPQGSRVLDLGCGTGDILASVQPKVGIGVDISQEMIKRARTKHPHLIFKCEDIYTLTPKGRLDAVIMADVVDHLPDISQALSAVRKILQPQTRVVISTINPVWEPILDLGEKLGQKMPEGPHNWVIHEDLTNLIELAGYRIEKKGFRVLIPKNIPMIADWVNNNLQALGPLKRLGAVQYFVCKKVSIKERKKLSCTVVIPAHNEADNLKNCLSRIPPMGSKTETIVVDDGSTDNTAAVVRAMAKQNRSIKLISFSQNRGKALAVKAGFDAAKGQVLVILDADMSVPPEELTYCYDVIASGQADFVNGTRMVYPMENQAMRQLHLFGNKVFSSIFSWLLGQRVTDTLCGTKALLKKDYRHITMGTEPWGDFDLLFGAAKLHLKIKEFPVHYKRRVAGESKMRTFSHGSRLLLMCLKGIWELKLS